MGYLEGLLGGFTARKGEVESENLRQSELASAREADIFKVLLGSDREDLQALAVAGMLDSANPKKRKGGIRGWLGEMEGSPHLSQIQEILRMERAGAANGGSAPPAAARPSLSPRPDPAAAGLPPSVQAGSDPHAQGPAPPTRDQIIAPANEPALMITAPPAPTAPAAMPTTSPVAPRGSAQAGGPPRPQPIFLPPEERLRRDTLAKSSADVEGEVAGLIAAGFSQEEAQALVKRKYERQTGGAFRPQSVAGEVPNEQGGFTPAFGIFMGNGYVDPDSSQPIENFRPRTSTASGTLGIWTEAAARQSGYPRAQDVPPGEAMQRVNALAAELQRNAQQQRTEGVGVGLMNRPADFDASRQNNVPLGASPNQALGQTVPTEAELGTRRSVETVRSQLTHIKADLLGVLPRQGELAGLAPGAAWAIRRRSPQYRTQIASLESAINNIVNVMARSVAEQRGAQTEADAIRAEAAIVQMRDAVLTGDTQESAGARIDESLRVLEGILGHLPGVVVPGGGPPAPATAGRPGAAASPAGPPGLFVGADGQLHTGSATGPLYQPGR